MFLPCLNKVLLYCIVLYHSRLDAMYSVICVNTLSGDGNTGESISCLSKATPGIELGCRESGLSLRACHLFSFIYFDFYIFNEPNIYYM